MKYFCLFFQNFIETYSVTNFGRYLVGTRTHVIASPEITDSQGVYWILLFFFFFKFKTLNGLTKANMDGVLSEYMEGTV